MVCTYVTFQARNAITGGGQGPRPPLPRARQDGKVRLLPTAAGPCHRGPAWMSPSSGHYLDSARMAPFLRPLRTEIADFPSHLSIHVGGMIDHRRNRSRRWCPWSGRGRKGGSSASGTRIRCDDAGLIKVDLLGLRMLSLIDEISAPHQGAPREVTTEVSTPFPRTTRRCTT